MSLAVPSVNKDLSLNSLETMGVGGLQPDYSLITMGQNVSQNMGQNVKNRAMAFGDQSLGLFPAIKSGSHPLAAIAQP